MANPWKEILRKAKFRILVSDQAELFREIEDFSDSSIFRENIIQLIFYFDKDHKLSISVQGNPTIQQQLPRRSSALLELAIEAIERARGDWIEDFAIEISGDEEDLIELGTDWKRVRKEIERFNL